MFEGFRTFNPSRRNLLRGTAGLGLTAGVIYLERKLHGAEVLTAVLDQENTWENAVDSNSDFLKKNDFSNVVIGCSFSRDHLNFLYNKYISPKKEATDQDVRAALHLLHGIGIEHFRVGIPIDTQTSPEPGQFVFDKHRSTFDTILDFEGKICKGLGLKVQRWPEYYFPDYFAQYYEIPEIGATISSDNRLANFMMSFIESRVVPFLKKEYGNLDSTQWNNESYAKKIAERQWVMAEDFMLDGIAMIRSHFPKERILMNSTSETNLTEIDNTFSLARDDKVLDWQEAIYGVNFYPNIPKTRNLTGIQEGLLQAIGKDAPFLDPITRSVMDHGGNRFHTFRDRARARGAPMEVTELQLEPFLDPGGDIMSPGSSVQEARFTLARARNHIINADMPSLIRIWGAEWLAFQFMTGRATKDHLQIADLIERINKGSQNARKKLYQES